MAEKSTSRLEGIKALIGENTSIADALGGLSKPKPPIDVNFPIDFSLLDLNVPRTAEPRTATLLAQSSIGLLEGANSTTLQQALNSIISKGISAADLMRRLETGSFSFSDVINELASGWPLDTKKGFAETFGISDNQLDVMDSIVSIAILNDPKLESRLKDENISAPTQQGLLENSIIKWQYPPAGTELEPPYLVFVAVEFLDAAPAEKVAQSILEKLVTSQGGLLVPRLAAQKLG